MSDSKSPSTLATERLNKIARDGEGFLLDPMDWTPSLSHLLAAELNIRLSDEHNIIIQLVRTFYLEHCCHLTARALSKHITAELGADKGKSLYLLSLFPKSPAKLTAYLAGLPKPPFCF